jgi:hypothetical protein
MVSPSDIYRKIIYEDFDNPAGLMVSDPLGQVCMRSFPGDIRKGRFKGARLSEDTPAKERFGR